MREAWGDDVPTVYVYRPACPVCNCEKYIGVRLEQNGDGSATRKAICRACSSRFKIVLEPLPVSGNELFDDL